TLVERSLKSGSAGPYAMQAAIAAVYSESIDGRPSDWAQIVALHDVLGRLEPSPVGQLARAIAVAGRDGPAEGLRLVEEILEQGALENYLPAHAARADLCRQLRRTEEALTSLHRALELAQQEPERRYFHEQITRLQSKQFSGANVASQH